MFTSCSSTVEFLVGNVRGKITCNPACAARFSKIVLFGAEYRKTQALGQICLHLSPEIGICRRCQGALLKVQNGFRLVLGPSFGSACPRRRVPAGRSRARDRFPPPAGIRPWQCSGHCRARARRPCWKCSKAAVKRVCSYFSLYSMLAGSCSHRLPVLLHGGLVVFCYLRLGALLEGLARGATGGDQYNDKERA